MPSIAGFIQSLLSEDMYATGMIERMDERIADLNNGQLRLLLRFCEMKAPALTNKTVLDAYKKLLKKATAETDKRHEEEVRGERERLRLLKAAHAGVNAKAWDTSHASLDSELAKFQKFLKSKARRVAEEEVLQDEMEKLHRQLLAIPARRVAADNGRRLWWMVGAALLFGVAPILALCLLPVGIWPAIGSLVGSVVLAVMCWFIGVVRGIVVAPTLDDDVIEDKTRKRAKEKLKEYRAEVRRNYEEFEQAFAADMKWRDDWAKSRKEDRRKERRKTSKEQIKSGRGDSSRIAPGEEDPPGSGHCDPAAGENGGGGGMISSRAASEAADSLKPSDARAAGTVLGSGTIAPLDSVAVAAAVEGELGIKSYGVQKRFSSEHVSVAVAEGVGEEAALHGHTRGPCQGSRLMEEPNDSEDLASVRAGEARRSPSVGGGVEDREGAVGSQATLPIGGEKSGDVAV